MEHSLEVCLIEGKKRGVLKTRFNFILNDDEEKKTIYEWMCINFPKISLLNNVYFNTDDIDTYTVFNVYTIMKNVNKMCVISLKGKVETFTDREFNESLLFGDNNIINNLSTILNDENVLREIFLDNNLTRIDN